MTIDVVLIIADQKQFPPAVFLASRLASLRRERRVDIVLATDSPAALAQAREFGGAFHLLDLSKFHAELRLPLVGRFPRATYFSLLAPKILQQRYRRLLYLDVDTYPESDKIFALFDLDMEGETIAAVRDLHVAFMPNRENAAELSDTLKVPPGQWFGSKYLNSGALLIDLAAYRERRIEKQALRLLREPPFPIRFPDQTIFNAILNERWLELSPSFNMVTRAWASFIRDLHRRCSRISPAR